MSESLASTPAIPGAAPARRANKPWGPFFLKCSILLSLIWGSIAAFTHFYVIGYDPQMGNHSTAFTWFLVRKGPVTPVPGRYVAFEVDERHAPWFSPGLKMVKHVAGVAGDRVQVKGDLLLVNDVARARRSARILGKVQQRRPGYVLAFDKPFVIPPGEIILLNENPESFDSRYWGTVKVDRLVGSAIPLF